MTVFEVRDLEVAYAGVRVLLLFVMRLVLLVEGRVVLDGCPSEVMGSGAIRKSCLGVVS